ncbi:MAG: hypothetical protein SFV54_06755 [Bryobacteraceae bacterium]|nr:hypothetical protein [Bryobacteraceae bacterium]
MSAGFPSLMTALHVPPDSGEVAGFAAFGFIDGGPEIELMYGLRGERWGKGPGRWG